MEPSISAEDPWEGMEILDFEGDLDDLVRASMKNLGDKIVGNLKGDGLARNYTPFKNHTS